MKQLLPVPGPGAPLLARKERGTQDSISIRTARATRQHSISDSAESPLPVDASQFRRISSSFGLMGTNELGRATRSDVIIHGKKETGNFQEEAGNAATGVAAHGLAYGAGRAHSR